MGSNGAGGQAGVSQGISGTHAECPTGEPNEYAAGEWASGVATAIVRGPKVRRVDTTRSTATVVPLATRRIFITLNNSDDNEFVRMRKEGWTVTRPSSRQIQCSSTFLNENSKHGLT